mmetsp:Transcript_11187/g.28045  ORF Transcript_11187/g.28045 Transcript_11187/m.28045 type:complete len:213 (+) Transcript_11187:2487-3125(+)
MALCPRRRSKEDCATRMYSKARTSFADNSNLATKRTNRGSNRFRASEFSAAVLAVPPELSLEVSAEVSDAATFCCCVLCSVASAALRAALVSRRRLSAVSALRGHSTASLASIADASCPRQAVAILATKNRKNASSSSNGLCGDRRGEPSSSKTTEGSASPSNGLFFTSSGRSAASALASPALAALPPSLPACAPCSGTGSAAAMESLARRC